jgi:hypothetical protein
MEHQTWPSGPEYPLMIGALVANLASLELALRHASTKVRASLANGNQRRAMSKDDRILVVGEAIKNFPQPAHHVEDDGDTEIFSGLDAAWALATTVSLVAMLSGPRVTT